MKTFKTGWFVFPPTDIKCIESVEIMDKSIPKSKRHKWERIIKRALERAFHK